MFDYKNDYIITKPTRDEQIAAHIDTSDFMISGLTIQSDILHTFGFCSKVYRSKVTVVQKSTKRMISKYLRIINNLLTLYKEDDPASKVFGDLSINTSALSDLYHIDFSAIFGCGATSWDNLSKMEVLLPVIAQETRAKYAKPPRFKYNFDKDDVEEIEDNYEPSAVEVQECKELYAKLQNWIAEQKKTGISYRKFAKRCNTMESVLVMLSEPDLADIKDDILSFKGTVGELKKFLDSYLNSQSKGTVRGHSQTIMEMECLEKQKEVAAELERNGLCFNFEGFRYYLENYTPYVIDDVLAKYNLDLYTIHSFEELRAYLYEPKRMHAIRSALGVKVRSRSRGHERKGGKWMVKSYNYEKRIEKLQNTVGEFNENDSSQRIKDLKTRLEKRKVDNEEAKKARKHAHQKYIIAQRSNNKEEINAAKREYDEMVKAANDLSKLLYASKQSLKKAKAEHKRKKTALDKIRQYREKHMEVIERVKDVVGNDSIIEKMESSFTNDIINEDSIPYSTWYFKVYGINEDVMRLITTELEHAFSSIKDSNDSRFLNYINVSSHAFLDENKNAISEFFIDYPKNGKLYKAFAKNPKFARAMMETISQTIHTRLGYYVDFDFEHSQTNVDMEKTLVGNNN